MTYKDMLKAAEENKELVEITVEFKAFDKKGEKLLGRLIKVTEVESQIADQTYNQYLFETDDGLIKCHLGRVTDGEAGALMKVGKVYQVVYQGKEKLTGGRSVNKFDITQIGGELEIPVGGAEDVPF